MTVSPRREPDLVERDPKRVIAFSDGVIAIAVTLLVLDIRPPDDTRHLLHGLLALSPSYVSYVITFMLVGQVWANHHVMFDHIRHADRMVLFCNTVLLMDIALLPFAAAVLASSFRNGQGERTAVFVHGVLFELAAVLFNVIWWYARRDRRLLADTIDAAGVRDNEAVPARARLDRHRDAAGRAAAAAARRSRDRGVHHLLLAADLRRDRGGSAPPGTGRPGGATPARQPGRATS
jgi:uncharacterized membrane protein